MSKKAVMERIGAKQETVELSTVKEKDDSPKLNNEQLTEKLFDMVKVTAEWQDTANKRMSDHDDKLTDHETRLKKLESGSKAAKAEPAPQPVKAEPAAQPAKAELAPQPVKAEPAQVSVKKAEPVAKGNELMRFDYPDGPCRTLWLYRDAETGTMCGPTDILTADKLGSGDISRAYVWIKNGLIDRFLSYEEIKRYYG